MIELKTVFPIPSFEQWEERLKKDLTEEDFGKLKTIDEVEEISLNSYAHGDNSKKNELQPGQLPFTRGLKTESNNWSNGYYLKVENELEDNQKMLQILMKGCDLIVLDLSNKDEINFNILLNNIGLEFISTQIILENTMQWNGIVNYFQGEIPLNVLINVDPISMDTQLFETITAHLLKKQSAVFSINSFRLLGCGANAFQEIGFAAATGHELIYRLMKSGLNIDQAAACIHFSMGIGSNYFVEIAKFRSIKTLWSQIIGSYNPVHNCSYNCRITAHTIALNKSIEDPYTNLLRQTTEGLSAICGGIEGLVIYPYDLISANGASALAQRMALNISLVLKEESYLDAVIDPLGGSYTIEELTIELNNKGWELFKKIESFGGMATITSESYIQEIVNETAKKRISLYEKNEKMLIGINKYPNPVKESNSYTENKSYLGIPELIIERELIKRG
jgi:methylmalonyl-CoA mutase